MRRPLTVAVVTLTSLGVVAGVAVAKSLTVTSTKLAAASIATPVMYPVSVTFTNGGQRTGHAEKKDSFSLVWSRQIDEPTLCSGWANASSTQSIALTWTITPGSGGADDTLTVTGAVPATCASGFHAGTIDLGATGYAVGGAVSFATTTALTVGASTSTLSIDIGNQSGTGATGNVSNVAPATWSCDAALRDRNARSCGSNLAASTTGPAF